MRGSRWAQFFALASTLLFCSSAALAYPPLTGAITTAYPDATNLDSCGTCHLDFNGGGALNAYGAAFLAADGLSDPAAAIAAIANDDSDGDGTSNAGEASNGAGFEPGLSCVTYTNATNAPGNLADFVDPTDIGCTGGGSTTTVPATTTTVFVTTSTTGATTTTTVSAPKKCSQPVTDGAEPLASDCLFILRTAVGSAVCDPACICDTNGTGGTSASDALLCLKKAVGQNVTLNCQCEGTTTTTLGGTTTTVPATTTTVGGATTTTLPTPTTTLGGGTTTTLPTPTTTLGGGTTTTVPAPTTTLGGGTTTTTVGGGTTTTVAPATTTTVGATTTTTIVVSAFGLN